MWGFAGPTCSQCGTVMTPAEAFGIFRCVPCESGLVQCPATHDGNKKACPLCKGAGYVESL